MRAAALFLLVLLFAAAFLALTASQADGFRGFAFILIGPVPLFIDSSDPSVSILLLTAVPLAMFALLLFFWRRVSGSV